MHSQERSTTGCWTCKLRRKKCDETKPGCTVCGLLSLECGGYGPRPDWMDRAGREKAMVAQVREIVKKATSQKKRTSMKKRHLRTKSAGGGEREDVDSPAVAVDPRLFYSYPITLLDFKDLDSPKLIDGPPSKLSSTEAITTYIKQNESTLLMHYLDSVFPLQFRFYKPSLEGQGRGWLLSLLLQTKPLYHAACSLAAFHRQTLYCLRAGKTSACFTLEALNLQYGLAITELQRYMEEIKPSSQERSLFENAQLLCSIALFVSIEACISTSATWKIHLEAAISLLPDIRKQLSVASRSDEILLPTYQVALSFFSSVIAWYDIVSSTTTTATAATAATEDSTSLGLEKHEFDKLNLHFDDAIGCEDWVVLVIRDIAELDRWKQQILEGSEQLGARRREIVARSDSIQARLRQRLEEEKNLTSAEQQSPGHDGNHLKLKSCITKIYCGAALIYLHVVMSGAHSDLPEIRHAVAQTIDAFKELPDPALVNSLVWPFCIAGCMAQEQRDESFFRGCLTTIRLGLGEPGSDATFGVSRAWVIVEECWRLRKLSPSPSLSPSSRTTVAVDWRTAMKSLGLNILLV